MAITRGTFSRPTCLMLYREWAKNRTRRLTDIKTWLIVTVVKSGAEQSCVCANQKAELRAEPRRTTN